LSVWKRIPRTKSVRSKSSVSSFASDKSQTINVISLRPIRSFVALDDYFKTLTLLKSTTLEYLRCLSGASKSKKLSENSFEENIFLESMIFSSKLL